MNRAALLIALALTTPLSTEAAVVCRIVSGSALAFGAYDVLATVPADSETRMTVTCTRNGGPRTTTLQVRVGQGMNGNSVSSRRMLHTGGSGDTLAYGLYRDVARSRTWGTSDTVDTMSAVLTLPNPGTGSATFTIYGRIPVGQDVSAGTYGDVVQVTVIY